jgi:hypothetical protein
MSRFRTRTLGPILALAMLVATGLTTAPTADAAGPECFGKKATIADHAGLIVGTPGNDVIVGDNGPNDVAGKGGTDLICGLGGKDLLFGDDGDDRISGGNGADAIAGGFGNDRILGDGGNDHLVGHDGNDTLIGGPGADTLSGNGLFGVGVDVCHQGNAASRPRDGSQSAPNNGLRVCCKTLAALVGYR